MKNLLATVPNILLYVGIGIAIISCIVIIAVAIVVVKESAKKRKKQNENVCDEKNRYVESTQKESAKNNEPFQNSDTETQATLAPQETQTNHDKEETADETIEVDDGSLSEPVDTEEEIVIEVDDESDDDKKNAPKEEKEDAPKRKVTCRILYNKDNKMWEVRKEGTRRYTRRVRTKKEALDIVRQYSKKQDLNIVVHKRDGKFQKKDSWSRKINNGDNEGK